MIRDFSFVRHGQQQQRQDESFDIIYIFNIFYSKNFIFKITTSLKIYRYEGLKNNEKATMSCYRHNGRLTFYFKSPFIRNN